MQYVVQYTDSTCSLFSRREEQQKLLRQKQALEEAKKEEEGRDKYVKCSTNSVTITYQ